MICKTPSVIECCLQEAQAEESERRRLRRKPFLRQATIMMAGDSVPAFCRDISRDGIGLLHSVALEADTAFQLAVPVIGSVLQLECQVNWCRPVSASHYFSGSVYHCGTTPQTLVWLSAVLSDELNRRLFRRYPFVRQVELAPEDGEAQSAFSRDISRGGIGLIHRQPLPPGPVAVTIPSKAHGELVGTADIQRCRSIGEGWFASGGPFPLEEIPGPDEMRLTCHL
jgi:hypothetical protein